MSPAAESLRVALETQDIDSFLQAYESYQQNHTIEPEVTGLTQRVFPPLLRKALDDEQLRPASVVRLYRMVRDSRLVLVDNDLIIGINRRIDGALLTVDSEAAVPAQPLLTFKETRDRTSRAAYTAKEETADSVTEMKRISLRSTFTIGVWSSVDAFDFRMNVCASRQEREFLSAVRQFFPSLQAYPNMPLKSFIDIEKLEARLPVRARSYAWLAQVDVLLCTADEDPVAGIELDSEFHDSEDGAERDVLKNKLFKLAGLPLVRIRPDDVKAVRAEDFYDLLMAEAATLDAIRPRRLRPRRSHECLVPAKAQVG